MAGVPARLARQAIHEPGEVGVATMQLLVACCAYRWTGSGSGVYRIPDPAAAIAVRAIMGEPGLDLRAPGVRMWLRRFRRARLDLGARRDALLTICGRASAVRDRQPQRLVSVGADWAAQLARASVPWALTGSEALWAHREGAFDCRPPGLLYVGDVQRAAVALGSVEAGTPHGVRHVRLLDGLAEIPRAQVVGGVLAVSPQLAELDLYADER